MTIFFNICSLCILIKNASYNVAAAVSQQNEIENLNSVVFNDDLTNTLPILSNYIIDKQSEIDSNFNSRDDSSNNIYNEYDLKDYNMNDYEKKNLNQIYNLDSIDLCVPKEIEPLINNSTDDETNKPVETFCKTDIDHQEHEQSNSLGNFNDIFCDLFYNFNQDTSDKYMSKNMLEKSQENLEMQNINNIDNVLCATNNSNMINHIPFFEDKQSNSLLNDAFENHSNETLTNENIQSTVNSKDKNLYLLQNFYTENSKKLIKSQNIQQNDNEHILQNTWNCDQLLHIQQHSKPPIGQSEPEFLELVNFINSNQNEHDFQNNYFNFLLYNTINPCTNQQSDKINNVEIVENGLSKPDTFQYKVLKCANSNYPNQWNDEYKNFNSFQKRKSKQQGKVQEEHSQPFINKVLVDTEQNSANYWKYNETNNPRTNLPNLHNSYFQLEGLKFEENKNQETSNNLGQENSVQNVLNNKKLKYNMNDDINYCDQRQHSTLDEILNREDASLTYEEIKQTSEAVKNYSNNLLNLSVDTNKNQMYIVIDKFKPHNSQTFTRKEPTEENTNYNRKVNEISDQTYKKIFINKNTIIKTFNEQIDQMSIKNHNNIHLNQDKVKEKKTRNNHKNKSKFKELFLLDDVFIDNLNNVTTISRQLESSNLLCHSTKLWLDRKYNQYKQTQNDISYILQRFTKDTNFFEINIISVLSTINKIINTIYSIYLDLNKFTINFVQKEDFQQDSVIFKEKIRSLYFELQNSSNLNLKIVDLTFFRKDYLNFTNIIALNKLSDLEMFEIITRFNKEFREKNETFYNFIALDEFKFCNSKVQIQNTSGILENNIIQKILKYSESIKKIVKKITNNRGNYKNRTVDVMQDYFRIRLKILCTKFVKLCRDIEENTEKDILYKKMESNIESLTYVLFCIDSLYLFTSLKAKPDIYRKFIYISNRLNSNIDKIFFESKHDLISSIQLKKLSYKHILHYHFEVYIFLEIFQYFSLRYLSLMHF